MSTADGPFFDYLKNPYYNLNYAVFHPQLFRFGWRKDAIMNGETREGDLSSANPQGAGGCGPGCGCRPRVPQSGLNTADGERLLTGNPPPRVERTTAEMRGSLEGETVGDVPTPPAA